jgi:hypothetical protein
MRISVIAVGSRGDVQPYVAMGRGLRRAGHSVRVVTHAPFEAFVRGNGLDFSALGGERTAEFALPGVLPSAPPWLGPLGGWYNLLCGRSTEWFFAHPYEPSYEKAQEVLGLPPRPSRQLTRELGTPTLLGTAQPPASAR